MKRTLILAAWIGMAGLTAVPAKAIETDTVRLGGQVVMRIRAGAHGSSPSDRGDAVRSRLAEVLARSTTGVPAITVRQERAGGEAGIFVGETLVIQVDRTLTEANGQGDPRDLAVKWAENLGRALPQAVAQYMAGSRKTAGF